MAVSFVRSQHKIVDVVIRLRDMKKIERKAECNAARQMSYAEGQRS